MPSSQMTVETPERDSTSRSRRSSADGPPAKGVFGSYGVGPVMRLPPMPALTTAKRGP